MKLLASLLLGWTLLTAAPSNDQAAPSGVAWLALIDTGKYAESWKESSSFFRAKIAEKQWSGMAQGARAPLGALVARKQLTVTFAKTLPGAPDGDYAVIQYQSSFKNKASAIETLTLMMDGDKWRAAGYFIR